MSTISSAIMLAISAPNPSYKYIRNGDVIIAIEAALKNTLDKSFVLFEQVKKTIPYRLLIKIIGNKSDNIIIKVLILSILGKRYLFIG